MNASRPGYWTRLVSISILVLGLFAALVVALVSTAENDASSSYRIANGQSFADDGPASREMQQLERLGGKAAVQTFRFQRWFDSLWHGTRLAAMLAVVTIVIAMLGWHLAGLMDESPP